ncbi:MAG: phage virion morphogenesis protein [Planctomycetaceae bacterium]
MGVVRTQLVEDPRFLGAVFQEIENAYRDCDYQAAIDKLVPAIVTDHAGYFSNRTSPNGVAMAPLSPVTVAKKGHDRPLVETDAMRQSLLQSGHPEHLGGTSHRGLVFGTSDEKATIHQHGTKRIPARPFVGWTEERVDDAANKMADHLVEALKG